MTPVMFGLFNLGGGEIILILILLSVLLFVPAVLIGIIFVIVRLTRKTANPAPSSASSGPPPIQGGRP